MLNKMFMVKNISQTTKVGKMSLWEKNIMILMKKQLFGIQLTPTKTLSEKVSNAARIPLVAKGNQDSSISLQTKK